MIASSREFGAKFFFFCFIHHSPNPSVVLRLAVSGAWKNRAQNLSGLQHSFLNFFINFFFVFETRTYTMHTYTHTYIVQSPELVEVEIRSGEKLLTFLPLIFYCVHLIRNEKDE